MSGNSSRFLLDVKKKCAVIGSDHHLLVGILRIQVRKKRREGEHA
jgi:hypothetical protein